MTLLSIESAKESTTEKKNPREIRIDISLVGRNVWRYFPAHPLEPNKIKTKEAQRTEESNWKGFL